MLRYQLRPRVTRALVLCLTTIIFLRFYTTQRLPSLFDPAPPRSDDRIAENERLSANTIKSLWHQWSKVIHDNAPQVQGLDMPCSAQQISVSSNDNGPRQPAPNCLESSEADIQLIKSSHSAFVKGLLSLDDPTEDVYHGTGIVVMGGGEYFGPAIIGLHMLRKHGCTLPVEIFIADQSEYEPSICASYLPKYNARCVVLSEFLEEGTTGPGSVFKVTHFQLKVLAILFSSFEKLLYLDSDSIPLINPTTELFATEPFLSTGLIIWPDFWIATESPLFYSIASLPSFPTMLPKSSSEAGQILINKKTHLKSLLLASYYNVFGPDIYYPLLSQGVMGQGDKETFMAAALVLGEPFHRVHTAVAAAGRHTSTGFKGSAMVQFHPADDLLRSTYESANAKDAQQIQKEIPKVRPAFIHANTPKMNAGHLVDEGDLIGDDGKRVRLWGSKEEQERIFGYDLERMVWELLRKTGCELALVIEEWKHRPNLCARLEEHWKEVF